MIGRGGDNALDTAHLTGGVTVAGNITATAGGALSVIGGSGYKSFAQIGNAGRGFGSSITASSGSIAGNITGTAAGNLTVQGGTNSRTYAHIGNGGRYAVGAATLP